MGALLEPTVDMGPWHVEVRRESAYLLGEAPNWQRADGAPPEHTILVLGDSSNGHGFAIPAGDRTAVKAAIEQIIEHPAYRDWAAENEPAGDGWQSETVDGWLRLHGPDILFGSGEPWRVSGAVELEYRHLAPLLTELAGVQ